MAGNLHIQIPYKLGQQPMLPMAGMPNMTLPPVFVPMQSIFTPSLIVDINKDIDLSSVFEGKQSDLKIEIPERTSLLPEYNEEIKMSKKEYDILYAKKKEHENGEDIKKLRAKIKEILSGKGFFEKEYENLFRGEHTSLIPKHNYPLSAFIEDVLCSLTEEKHLRSRSNIKMADFLWDKMKEFSYLKNDTICDIDNIIAWTNEENEDIAFKLCSDEKFFSLPHLKTIGQLIRNTNKLNHTLSETICQNPDFLFSFDSSQIKTLLSVPRNEKEVLFSKKLLANYSKFNQEFWVNDDSGLSGFSLVQKNFMNAFVNAAGMLEDFDIDAEKLLKEINEYRNSVLKNFGLYLSQGAIPIFYNGKFDGFADNQSVLFDFDDPSAQDNFRAVVDGYFLLNQDILPILFELFDKESIDNLFRRRLAKAQDYLDTLGDFNTDELQVLKKMLSCNNKSDKPFSPSQKIEFIDSIKAFKNNNIPLAVIEEAITDNKFDLEKIKIDLLKNILKNCGLSPKELAKISDKNIMQWNLDYMHLLPKSIDEYPNHFPMIIRAACRDDFMQYIHDSSNEFGRTNQTTKKIFENENMNYENWIHPDKNLKSTFVTRDKNTELLSQTAALLLEDIEVLRKSPVKKFFDKNFARFIEDDKFHIPEEITLSKTKLKEFIKNMIEQLKPVWKRADKNKDNPQKQETARQTLAILSHLKTKVESLEEMQEIKTEKSYDLTIKMIDRIPQKDLFQGNYSTCCIRVGEPNSVAMCDYLMNTAFNMLELVDNNTGKTIGNALCYFVKNDKGNIIFVVDNIEINNSCKPSSKTGAELRDKIFEYAANIAKAVTGKETEIVMSKRYNDVPINDLIVKYKKVKLLGKTENFRAYMDLFDGWTTAKDFQTVDCYQSPAYSSENEGSIIKRFVNWLKK